MFLVFTPFTYLFLLFYFVVLFCIFSISNFYVFWLYIEVLILLYIGISYTLFCNSYTQLMLYFLVQTVASFSLLVFFRINYYFLFCMFLFLKLGMFPFFSWYIAVLYRFPSFVLAFRSTIHKLPPLLLLGIVLESSIVPVVVVSGFLSLLVGGFLMLTVYDFRYLLIVSSIANNFFLILGAISEHYVRFSAFFILYTFTIFALLASIRGFLKPLLIHEYFKISFLFFVGCLLFNIASLPPFPMFFVKFFLIYDFLSCYATFTGLVIFSVLVNVSIAVSYCQLVIKYFSQAYSSSFSFFLY